MEIGLKFIGYVLSGILMLLGSGCTSTNPVRVEQDFGNSVRQMIQAQIYDPEAARRPPVDPPLALDGPAAGKALEAYRREVGQSNEPVRELPLNIRMGR